MAGCRKLDKKRQQKRELIRRLHLHEGFSSSQIASITGIPQRTVTGYLGKIRKEQEQRCVLEQVGEDRVNQVLMMPWGAA
ncbi:hypothetical protein [Endozoicomonas sp. ISHI1]|uniref:hypothetical protein n=1 Tax=Endozoicomonas sp. ISHI1 TaxID=2825882 RepID=UPI002147B1FA|nr:hypothetical protein [Endozoicomonas sp. ISHI1]